MAAFSAFARCLAPLLWLVLAQAGLAVFSLPVAAQTPRAPLQAARERGRAALELMQHGDYAGAERALTEALTLHAAPTLYYRRGQTREQQNKLLGAVDDYRHAAQFPVNPDEHAKYNDARRDAQLTLDALTARIPQLTIRTDDPLIRLSVNGVDWPSEVLPLTRALDPGSYRVELVDGAGQRREYHVELAAGEHKVVQVQDQHTRLVSESVNLPAPQPVPAPRPRPANPTSPALRYTLGAVTLALAGSALVTGLVALNRRADFHERNLPDVAMDEKQRLRSTASTWGWVSTALTAAAVGSAAGFVYVTYLAPESGDALGGLQLTATATF